MSDLKSKKLIYFKGFLFLFGGTVASFIILLENFSWKMVAMLTIAIPKGLEPSTFGSTVRWLNFISLSIRKSCSSSRRALVLLLSLFLSL